MKKFIVFANTMKKIIVLDKHYEKNNSVFKHYEFCQINLPNTQKIQRWFFYRVIIMIKIRHTTMVNGQF